MNEKIDENLIQEYNTAVKGLEEFTIVNPSWFEPESFTIPFLWKYEDAVKKFEPHFDTTHEIIDSWSIDVHPTNSTDPYHHDTYTIDMEIYVGEHQRRLSVYPNEQFKVSELDADELRELIEEIKKHKVCKT